MKTSEDIVEIRTVLLPGFLGVDRITQEEFAYIVSRIGSIITSSDYNCSKRDVQRWEYSENGPSHTPKAVIERIRKAVGNKRANKTEKMPWFKEDRRDRLDSFVSKIMR